MKDAADDGLPLFSQGSRSVKLLESQWLTDATVADEVESRIGKFAHQPPVQILDHAVGTLPGATAGDRIAGAVHQGRIYLFRDELGSRSDVQRTLFHELLHYGLRRFLSRQEYQRQMLRLADRDGGIRRAAVRWVMTDEGTRADTLHGADYALARGVDEVLATLAEPNGGEFLRTGIGQRAARAVTRWLAEIAEALGFKGAASELRAIKSEEARELIQSVFKRLREDAPASSSDWGFTADPAFQKAWHGTPHRGIKKFSTDALGTGEGAQPD